MSKSKVWIEAGYKQFALAGLEGIHVERLAKILDLNKSGYYHYFGDQQTYLEKLMEEHLRQAIHFAEDLKQARQIDPGLLDVLVNWKTPLMFHAQLVRDRHYDLLKKTYDQVNGIVDPIVIKLFADFIGFKNHLEFASKYYSQVRDMFYAQITDKYINHLFLREFMLKAKEVVQHAVAIAAKTNS